MDPGKVLIWVRIWHRKRDTDRSQDPITQAESWSKFESISNAGSRAWLKKVIHTGPRSWLKSILHKTGSRSWLKKIIHTVSRSGLKSILHKTGSQSWLRRIQHRLNLNPDWGIEINASRLQLVWARTTRWTKRRRVARSCYTKRLYRRLSSLVG